MCGICGIRFWHERPVEKTILTSMNRMLTHRGPDDEGYYTSGSVGLAARRLSIIDVEGGHQPMSNEDGTVWIVCNGEIYNFLDLRTDLEQRGHRFATRSDTETVVQAYEEWGERCVEHLRGMFAFAIHDRRPQTVDRNNPDGRLFLARDRLGIKPLYYARLEEGAIFSSEVKALLASERVARRLNPLSLVRYLQWGSVPGPETIIEGVNLLPPGHFLVIDANGVRAGHYWGWAASPTPSSCAPATGASARG